MNPRDFTPSALSQILPEISGLSRDAILRIEEIFASDAFQRMGSSDRKWMENSLVEVLEAHSWQWPDGEKIACARQNAEGGDGDTVHYVVRLLIQHVAMTGYALFRRPQLLAGTTMSPYWQYKHSDVDEYPCSEHAIWDDLVLYADDSWWIEHFPPNGVGCGCFIYALNFRDLERMGKSGPDVAP